MDFHSFLDVSQDIIDLVIDILADQSSDTTDEQSRKALTDCLLVSSSFYQSARPHIFKCITWNEPCEPSLVQIFENDPLRDIKPVTNYVRHLFIVVNPDGFSLTNEGSYKPWVQLTHILESATNLVSLSFQSDSENHSIRWNRLHSITKDAIRKKCRSVATLKFCGITDFSLALLAQCVNLKELHLVNLRKVNGEQCDWNPDNLTELEILNVDNTDGIFSKLQATPPVALSKLKHFKYLPPRHWTEETDFLRRSTDSLESLSLCDVVDSPGSLSGIKLSEFTALRSLRVRTETVPFDDAPPQIPTFLLNSLITNLDPNSTTTIEEITIELSVFVSSIPAYDDYQELLRAEHWSTIDKTLTGHQYPALKKIHFAFWDTHLGQGVDRIRWDYRETESSKAWFQDRARTILPRTHSAAIETEVEHFVFGMTKDSHVPDWS